MSAYNVVRVIYSPVKAFKEIVQKPSIIGVALILVLTLAASAGLEYVVDTKISVEVGTPGADEWTESDSHWSSDGNVTLDNSDMIVGNNSVRSFASNTSTIMLRRALNPSINLSEGFERLNLRIKWLRQDDLPPQDAAVTLFAANESNYFEYSLTPMLNTSDTWSNLTINIGAPSWLSVGSPIRENITGILFQFSWLSSSNLTLKIDDLFFGSFEDYVGTAEFTNRFTSFLMLAIFNFMITWLLLGVVLLLIMKLYNAQTGPWRPALIVFGYVLTASVIGILVRTAVLTGLPQAHYPFLSWRYLRGDSLSASENEAAIDLLVASQEGWLGSSSYLLNTVVQYVVLAWTVVLCGVAVRSLTDFSWGKSILIGVFGYILMIFVSNIILGLTGI